MCCFFFCTLFSNLLFHLSGISDENLSWIYCEAKKLDDESGTFHRLLLIDEMSIQQDLQVIKCGPDWEVVGAVDLGPLVNDLDQLSKKKKEIEMA